MAILLQPWSLLLFGVVTFFVFLTIGAKEEYKGVTPLTRWIIVGICVVIATFGVYSGIKIQLDRNRNPFQSGTEVAPVTTR
jgi:hypothetical protein